MTRLKVILASVTLAVGLVTLSILTFVPTVNAASWKAGRIIDDSVFYNKNAMDVGQIQAFLNSKVPNCDTNGDKTVSSGQTRRDYSAERGVSTPFICLKDYKTNTVNKSSDGFCNGHSAGNKSAAQIIHEVAQSCNVSPKVLIVLLQKEQSLITDDWPWPVQYQKATGYGCPDTAPCNAEYFGLFNQVYNAARQFRVYQAYPHSYNHISRANNNVRFHPNSACGSSTVFIENQATAGLYNYTPYQPNQAKLSGSPDGCSSNGNYNFWKLYWDWFGNPLNSKPYQWLLEGKSAYRNADRTQTFFRNTISIAPGEKAYLRVKARNSGTSFWNSSFTRLATIKPRDRESSFRDGSWVSKNRAARLIENSVAPGEVGTFEFTITAPNKPREYIETFSLVAEGKAWMNTINTGVYIHVVEPADATNTNNKLESGDSIGEGDSILSSGRQSALWIHSSNPILYNSSEKVWTPGIAGNDTDLLTMQSDGNLVVRNSHGAAIWDSGTWGNPGAYAMLQEDGNLVIRDSDGDSLWASNTSRLPVGTKRVNQIMPGAWRAIFPGQTLETPDRRHRLSLQHDGNLVLRRDGHAVWDSGTWGKNPGRLVLQHDGNLVLRDKNGRALWNTNTPGKGPARLKMQSDGNLVLRHFNGRATWDTKTNQ